MSGGLAILAEGYSLRFNRLRVDAVMRMGCRIGKLPKELALPQRT